MHDIRLIAVDLDGTLLNEEKKISEKDMRALRAATQKGVYLAIASGRIYKTVIPLSRKIAAGQPYLSSNGAVSGYNDQDGFIHALLLEDSLAKVILDASIALQCELHVHTMDGAMASLETPFKLERQRLLEKSGYAPVDEDGVSYPVLKEDALLKKMQGQTIKFVVQQDDEEKLLALRNTLSAYPLSIASSWKGNIEVMARDADKGSGLLKLAKALNIPMESVMVLGDNENDESMFKVAGFPVAMENAVPLIKNMAKAITLSNQQSGVGAAIEKYVL